MLSGPNLPLENGMEVGRRGTPAPRRNYVPTRSHSSCGRQKSGVRKGRRKSEVTLLTIGRRGGKKREERGLLGKVTY